MRTPRIPVLVLAGILAFIAAFVPVNASGTPPVDQPTLNNNWNLADMLNVGFGTQSAFASGCPSNGQMQEMLGFTRVGIKPVDVSVPWDVCHWLWTAVGISNHAMWLPGDWQFTYTRHPDQVVIATYGNKHIHIQGATMRFRPAASAWVNNPRELCEKELQYGLNKDPSYGTVCEAY